MMEFIHGVFRKKPAEKPNNPTLAKKRAGIINSILLDGLRSSKELNMEGTHYFGSVDGSPGSLHGRILNNFSNPTEQIGDALYAGGDSILPVMIEREREHKVYIDLSPDEKGLLTRRVCSVVLIVCKVPYYHDNKRIITNGIMPTEKFSYLLFPDTIWQETQPYLNLEKIKEVPVRVIKKEITRMVSRNKLRVPDFEGELLEILKNSRTSLWVHGVRLPTEEDVTTHLPSHLCHPTWKVEWLDTYSF